MTLLSYLERRLDNVIYRANFAPTRAAARQLVNHAHFYVNGKKMDIPSYRVHVNDVISIKPSSNSHKNLAAAIKNNEKTDGGWFNIKGGIINIVTLPIRENTFEKIDEQLIVEYYSR